MFEHNNVQNRTILRDVFIFGTWQHPKRSNSARLPHFSKCKPSKTKNSARLPSKMESWVQSWQTRTNAFCDFPLHLCKVLRLPRKIDARLYDVPHLSRHNGVHFFDISTSKRGPTLRCFVHFDLEMCFAPQRRAIFHLSSGQLAPHPPL